MRLLAFGLLICGALSVGLADDGPSAPDAIVERFAVNGERTTRLSLFDDRVVVLSVREAGERILYRKATLDETQYTAYLGAFQRDADAYASSERDEGLLVGELSGEIVLYIGPEAPRHVVYSPLAMHDLVVSRLLTTLDDLELWVSSVGPFYDSVKGWTPRRGDLVELANGQLARVTEFHPEQVLIISYEETAVIEVVPIANIPEVIRRVIEDEP